MTSLAVSFISIGRLPLLAQTPNNADLFFSLVITTDLYLHNVEMADQNPASGSLQVDVD